MKAMTKKAKNELERSIGCSLDLLPSTVVAKMYAAYCRVLAVKKREQDIEAKYAYPITAKKTKSETDKQYQKRKAKDESHYQHPKIKIKRYRQARHIHDGLVPWITCSCFRDDSNSTPCPFVPDYKYGNIVSELPHWWQHRYSLEHRPLLNRKGEQYDRY